jgi:hypothetical protein
VVSSTSTSYRRWLNTWTVLSLALGSVHVAVALAVFAAPDRLATRALAGLILLLDGAALAWLGLRTREGDAT